MRAEERPVVVHRLQRRQAVVAAASASHASTAAPKPYQPGSIRRHCAQLNTQGMARRSSMRCRALARGRAAADVEAGDLARAASIRGSSGRSRRSRRPGRDRRGRRAPTARSIDREIVGGRRRPLGLEQRRLERGGGQGLEVAPADLGVGVLGGDHLALLGDADRALHRARRLRQDRLVARAAAAADRAAAAVEQAQPDAVAPEHVDQRAARPCRAPRSRSGSRRPCCCRSSRASPPARRRALRAARR